MYVLYCFILILLFATKTSSSNLTNPQQKCLINIAENLNIKQIVLVSETNKFVATNIRLLKNFNNYNILTQFSNLRQLNQSIPRGKPNNFKFKTLYFLDGYDKFKKLQVIFNSGNELFLSENVWVVFNKTQNFESIHIPYNCQFIVIGMENDHIFHIREIYNTRIFTHDVYISEFAEWDEENGLEIFEPDFYQRRLNMNETLLVVINEYHPYPCPHVELCAYEEILEEMARILNFRPDTMRMKDLEKLWEEDVRLLYEIWIGFFVFDAYGYWKYSIAPIWKTPAFLHIKHIKLYEQGETSPHLRPFAPKVWLAIILWLLISGIFVTYIDLKINHLKNYSIVDSIFRSFESFTNQCGCLIPNAISSRIAAIMTRASPAILVPLYSAVVISFVTVKVTKLPFTDLQGMIQDGSFKFGYENNTLIGMILRESTSIEARAIHDKFLVPLKELPTNEDEAIDKICADPKFAFAFFNNGLFFNEQKCKIIQIPTSIYQTWDAFRLRKNSPYCKILNRVLKSFRSSGVLKKMEKIVYGEKPRDEETHDLDPVEFEGILELLLLIFSLYLIVPVILVIELIVFKISTIKK